MSNGNKTQRRAVSFRYSEEEHPLLHEWLNSQSNRTQSVIHALEETALESGADKDYIQETLRERIQEQQAQRSLQEGIHDALDDEAERQNGDQYE